MQEVKELAGGSQCGCWMVWEPAGGSSHRLVAGGDGNPLVVPIGEGFKFPFFLEILMIHIGTCGFSASRKKYFEEFKVVEIQKSFYTPISPELAAKWREQAPDDFEFVLKAPQTITHPPSSPTYRRYKGKMGDFGFFKVNQDTMESWEHFREIAKILHADIIIFQSPASFKEKEENVRNIYEFFNSIERDFVFGWEPRGNWSDETVRKICQEVKLIHVVDPFKREKVWGEFSYYRLHGIGSYRYRYSDEELLRLKKLVKDGDYVMFNNTNMWEDALRFKSLLSTR